MKKRCGLILAMPIEACALMGWKKWDRTQGYPSRRQKLGHDLELLCIRSGSGMIHALAATRYLISRGVSSVMVLGLAGGLQPLLKPGSMILVDSVLEENGRHTNPSWKTDLLSVRYAEAVLMNRGLSCLRGAVVTSPEPVMSAVKKKDLFAKTQALAVDMESAAVARAAAEAGLPLFIFRTVSDGASTSIPGDISDCFHENGTFDLSGLLRRIVQNPFLLGKICSMARDCLLALYFLRKAWNIQIKTGLPWRLASSDVIHRK